MEALAVGTVQLQTDGSSSLLTMGTACEASRQLPTGEEFARAVQRQCETARVAQKAWSALQVKSRLAILRKLRFKIASNPRDLAALILRQNLAETLAAEVLPLLDACRFLELEAVNILREKAVPQRGRPKWMWGNSLFLRPEPLGVVLIIGPSNYPLMLPGIQILQAIAAGNSVLIKPAVACSQSIERLVELALSVGLPPGVIQVLPESPEAATVAIREGVDKVILTGSANTGRAVSRELAESTTPSVMELSGCDPVFVLEDADLKLVSDCLLFGLTLNHGRTCMAPRRVFAKHSQVDEILRHLRASLRKRDELKSCQWNEPGKSETADQNRLSTEIRLLNSASPQGRVTQRMIDDAVSAGAKLVCDSRAPCDPSLDPGITILDHVNSSMSVAQADLFAQVLSFIRVESDTQALMEDQNCPFSLCASVFGSESRCQEFARLINSGCVVINDMIVPTADPRVPFGGRFLSGHGKTRGPAGLVEMTQLKAIVVPRRWFKPHLLETTKADAAVLDQLIRLEHAASPFQGLMAVPKMIKATIRQRQLRSMIGRR